MNDKCKSTDGLFEYVAPNVERPKRARKLPSGKIAHHTHQTRNVYAQLDAVYNASNAVVDAINRLGDAVQQSFSTPIVEQDASPAEYGQALARLHAEQADIIEAMRYEMWSIMANCLRPMQSKQSETSYYTVKFLLDSGMIEYLTVNWRKLERATD